MPKLKFLDAKMITRQEWSIIHSDISKVDNTTGRDQSNNIMDRMSLWKRIFKTQTKESVDEVDNSNYTPLPADRDNTGYQEPRSSYSKCKHFYQGTESQGNRFIGNKML